MTNMHSVTPAEYRMQQKGGSSHTEDIKNVVFPACMVV